MTPIFIFSLPRTGSTLLQRILLSDGRCNTVGEPSFLLRLLGRDDVIQRRATYGERLVDSAHQDLRVAWPGFDEAYENGVRELALNIYRGLAGKRDWFLDKTPRYHLIADQIVRIFPDAKFILLWRHPLAVAASLSSTFRKGLWSIGDYDIDLHAGLNRLYELRELHRGRVFEIRYEDLVTNPKFELEQLGDYLGWPKLAEVLHKPLITDNQGSLGDPTGITKYSEISANSRDTWKTNYNNWYRRKWAHNYYKTPRGNIARALGYDLTADLQAGPINFWLGIRDWRDAARWRRKIVKQTSHRRFTKEFFEHEGYHIRFW